MNTVSGGRGLTARLSNTTIQSSRSDRNNYSYVCWTRWLLAFRWHFSSDIKNGRKFWHTRAPLWISFRDKISLSLSLSLSLYHSLLHPIAVLVDSITGNNGQLSMKKQSVFCHEYFRWQPAYWLREHRVHRHYCKEWGYKLSGRSIL